MTNRARRRAILADLARREWLLRCLALATAACRCRTDAARARTLTIAYDIVDDVLNPWEEASARLLVFLPMARFTLRGDLEGRLAERWEHSPDHLEWTYYLRPNVKWHDGTPVTAHDVRFTLDLQKHVAAGGDRSIESLTVVDDRTIVVRFNGYPGFFNLGRLFYPRHLLARHDPEEFYRWEFWKHPIGNGPYRFVRHVPKTMMEFEANADYYRGRPRIERLILKLTGDTAGLASLLSGEADAMTFANPAEIPKFAADSRFRVYHRLFELVSRAIYWQNRHPLFADPSIRRALTLAIDRRVLLEVLNLPREVPVVDGVYTDRQLRLGELPDPLPHDPAQARALLDAAGWGSRAGGVRERDGRACRFTAIVPDAVGFPEMAVFIQHQLRRVGVDMQIQVLERGGVIAKRLDSGQFEAAFQQFRNEPWWLRRYLAAGSPIGYAAPEVVPLIEQIDTEAHPDRRDALYRDLTATLRRDLPITFLHPRVETYFTHRRVRGLSTPFHADPLWYAEDLWLEDEP